MNDVRARPRGCEIRFNTIVRDLFPSRSVLFDKIWLQLNYSWMTNCVSYGADGTGSFAFKSTARLGNFTGISCCRSTRWRCRWLWGRNQCANRKRSKYFFADLLRGLKKWGFTSCQVDTQRWIRSCVRQLSEIRHCTQFAVNKAKSYVASKVGGLWRREVRGANESVGCSRTSSCRSQTQHKAKPWLIEHHFVGEITLLAQSGDERQEIVWNLFHNSDS